MGKLIGQLFKEDIKSTILWFILPPIALASFLTLIVSLGDYAILQILSAISVSMVFIAPFTALIQIAVNDWNRFYGKNAAFYSSLPLGAGRITFARLINYILMGIIAVIVALVNLSILGIITSEGEFGVLDLTEMINYILNSIGGKLFLLIFLYVFMLGVMTVSEILLANTLGSVKGLNALGSFAPVLMFIVINAITGFIFTRAQMAVAGDYITSNIERANLNVTLASNPPYKAMLVPIAVNIILVAIMAGASYYIHNKKLSVA